MSCENNCSSKGVEDSDLCETCTGMNTNKYVEVVCLVLPTGETLWFKTNINREKTNNYLQKVLDKWKEEHPEFKNTPCTCGVSVILMPVENYMSIQAKIGPGCFEFPEG